MCTQKNCHQIQLNSNNTCLLVGICHWENENGPRHENRHWQKSRKSRNFLYFCTEKPLKTDRNLQEFLTNQEDSHAWMDPSCHPFSKFWPKIVPSMYMYFPSIKLFCQVLVRLTFILPTFLVIFLCGNFGNITIEKMTVFIFQILDLKRGCHSSFVMWSSKISRKSEILILRYSQTKEVFPFVLETL